MRRGRNRTRVSRPPAHVRKSLTSASTEVAATYGVVTEGSADHRRDLPPSAGAGFQGADRRQRGSR